MKYTRSFFSYIRRNYGINLLLVCVMSIILFAFIIIRGFTEDLGKQDPWFIDLDECEYYTPNELDLTCDQVEEFYQAVSNTVGRIDRLVLQSKCQIKVFNYAEDRKVSITSFYPFERSFISHTITDDVFEDEHRRLIPYDECDILTYGFFHAEKYGRVKIDRPSPNEICISPTSDEQAMECFQAVSISRDEISPYRSKIFLLTSWEKMKSSDSPIAEVSFVVPEMLTEEQLSEVNRLSKYLLGSEFVLYTEQYTKEADPIAGAIIGIGVGLAVFGLLQIFLYICSLRKQEFLVFEFCGETSWAILFHCLYHFVVLLLLTDAIGIGMSLVFNAFSRRYDLLIILRPFLIATTIIVFDLLALIICSVRIFFGQVIRKELRL